VKVPASPRQYGWLADTVGDVAATETSSMNPSSDFTGRVVFVVRGSSGLGRATARSRGP
jgi:hypothetical protein